MQNLITKAKTFLMKSHDTTTKEFLIFLCINFSFLINGLLIFLISALPALSQETSENTFRIYLGTTLICIWFVFLPFMDRDKKDKVIPHICCSLMCLFCIILIIYHWIDTLDSTTFMFSDIIVVLVSIPTIAYLLYCFIILVKITLLVNKKILRKLLPVYKEHERLKYIIESITSLLLSISSLGAALWAIAKGVEAFLN